MRNISDMFNFERTTKFLYSRYNLSISYKSVPQYNVISAVYTKKPRTSNNCGTYFKFIYVYYTYYINNKNNNILKNNCLQIAGETFWIFKYV